MRRRATRLADDFAAVLDGRGGVDPTHAPHSALGPLLAVAAQLRGLPLAAAPDFRDSLRGRLLAVAAVADAPALPNTTSRVREWAAGWRVQRRLATAAGAMAVVTAIGGVSLAASRSLPGQPFYGVKRGTEALQLQLARDSVDRGRKQLQHASTRLQEIGRMVGHEGRLAYASGTGVQAAGASVDVADRVRSTLRDMDDETVKGTLELTTAYMASRDNRPLQIIRRFADSQQSGLAAVIPELPSAVRTEAQTSLAIVESVDQRAQDLLTVGICDKDCPTAAPTGVPSASGSSTPEPAPQTAPTPTPSAAPSDSLGPLPCDCASNPTAEPTPTSSDSESAEPTQEPTGEPTASQTPSQEPSSEPSASPSDPIELPVPLPSPLESAIDDLVDTVTSALPTPIPSTSLAPAQEVPDAPADAPADAP